MHLQIISFLCLKVIRKYNIQISINRQKGRCGQPHKVRHAPLPNNVILGGLILKIQQKKKRISHWLIASSPTLTSFLSLSSISLSLVYLFYHFFLCSILSISKVHGGDCSFGEMVVVHVGDGCRSSGSGGVLVLRLWNSGGWQVYLSLPLMVVVHVDVDGMVMADLGETGHGRSGFW